MSIGSVGPSSESPLWKMSHNPQIQQDITTLIQDLGNYAQNLGKGTTSESLFTQVQGDCDQLMNDIQSISPLPQGAVQSVYAIGITIGQMVMLEEGAAAGNPAAESQTHACVAKTMILLSQLNLLLNS